MRSCGLAGARTLAAIASASAMSGCWLTASFAGLGADGDGGVDGGADRSAVDGDVAEAGPPPLEGGAEAQAQDAGQDAGPSNLLDNPGFAGPGGPCGLGWTPNLGTLMGSAASDGGTHGCIVCPSDTAPGQVFELLSTTAPVAGAAGSTYQATAYFQFAGDAGPGASPPTGQIQLEYQYDGGAPLYTGSTPSTVAETPTAGTATLTFDAGDQTVQFLVLFAYPKGDAGGTGGCVLVSDVSLILQP